MSYHPKPRPKPPASPRPKAWDREILETLKRVRAFRLADLPHAPAEAAELDQVARELEAAGKIAIARWQASPGVKIIHRVTDGTPDPLTIARLK